MHRLLRWTSIALWTAGCSPRAVEPPAPERVFAAYGEITRDVLWPGFAPQDIPVAIYDGSDTWLFGHPAPPDDFTTVTPTVAKYRGRYPLLTANTAVDLAGIPTAALLLRFDLDDNPRAWAGLAIHEAFHVYQQEDHPDWGPNEASFFVYPFDDVTGLTGRRLETEALRRAVGSDSLDLAACWSRIAMDHRRQRFAVLESSLTAYERESERFEGLADYVEYRASGRRPALPAEGFPVEAVRLRTYATGWAMAVLLDRLAAGWQGEIDSGATPYLDLALATAVAEVRCDIPQDQRPSRDSVAAVAEHDIALFRGHLQDMRRRLLAKQGWTVIVVSDGGKMLMPKEFDPLNVDRVRSDEVIHHRWLRLEGESGWIEFLDIAGLTKGTPRHPLFDGVSVLTVPGLGSRPIVRDSSGTVLLRAGPLRAALDSAEVSWGPRTLRLRVP